MKDISFSMNDLRKQILLVVVSFILVACAPRPNHTAAQPICQPSATQLSTTGFPEIQAKMKTGGEIWALLFFSKAHAGEEEKIVWRISGTDGDLFIQAQNEAGKIIVPIWGPEYHGGSNWERPGEEWGTGFNFPEPGCWTLTVTSGSTIGVISLDVLLPQKN